MVSLLTYVLTDLVHARCSSLVHVPQDCCAGFAQVNHACQLTIVVTAVPTATLAADGL